MKLNHSAESNMKTSARRVFVAPVKKLLESSRLPVLLALLAVLLTLPALKGGWQLDDLYQRDLLKGTAALAPKNTLLSGQFAFLDGDPERNRFLMSIGALPWWTYEKIKISFFRPLSELSHMLDYRLWPDNAILMHLHSLLWLSLTVLAAALFYRRMLGGTWVGGLAALFYAVDHTHGIPAGWLANRNALLATFFGVMTLYVHDLWRQDRSSAALVAAPVFFGLALLSGEFAVAACAYLLSYFLFVDREPFRPKIAAYLPYAVIAIFWIVFYRLMDFGASGTDHYIDPASEPLTYLAALLKRAPLLLEGKWGIVPAQIYGFLPPQIATVFWSATLVFLLIIGLLLLPLLKNSSTARFFLFGMLLSLAPICATAPDNRLLLFAGVGAAALMAQFLAALMQKEKWLPRSRVWRIGAYCLAAYLIVFHGFLSAFQLPKASYNMVRFCDRFLNIPATTMPFNESLVIDKETLTGRTDRERAVIDHLKSAVIDQTAVLINPPLAFMAQHIPAVRHALSLPVFRRFHVLASGMVPLKIRRTDDRTLEIEASSGHFPNYLDRIYRSGRHPLKKNQLIEMEGLSVRVLSVTPDNRPQRVSFRFAVPLEDPSLCILYWKKGKFVPYTLPAVGETAVLHAIKLS